MDGTVENGFKEARVDVKEQEKPFLSNHGNLLMSGPLGTCDDPYCTICPSYFTSSSASVSLTPYKKNPFFSGAKNMHGKLVGWSKYRLPSVMNPHSKMVQLWNQFFVISCLFAIFVDPLFFLLFSVTETYFCIIFNDTLATAVTILRSLTDFIYFLHMLLQIITWILVRRLDSGVANAIFVKNLLRVTVLLQYIPRCIRFVPLALGSFAFDTARANFVINLFIYLLAAHVVGCSWYLFALQVRLFTVMEDIVLDAICERVSQRFYIKDSIISRTNYPLGRMLFILRGKLESIGDDGFRAIINQGEFCGEELLTWCIENAAIQSNSKKSVVRRTGQRAISSRMVKCLTNVEAFSLEAADLEYVANHFSRYMRNPRVQGAIRYESPYWRSWAARRIQAAWKYRKSKLNKSLLADDHARIPNFTNLMN